MNRQKKINKILAKKYKKHKAKSPTKTQEKYIAKADRDIETSSSKPNLS